MQHSQLGIISITSFSRLADHLKSVNYVADAEVRIAVMGKNAGAGLAAGLSRRLLDERRKTEGEELNVPLPACQLLIYPARRPNLR